MKTIESLLGTINLSSISFHISVTNLAHKVEQYGQYQWKSACTGQDYVRCMHMLSRKSFNGMDQPSSSTRRSYQQWPNEPP